MFRALAVLLLSGVCTVADAQTASQHINNGMDQFRRGDVGESLREFESAIDADAAVRPFLWQQGISQYYAEEFEAGRKLFESHRTVNPHDVENAAWHFLCAARAESLNAAREALMRMDPQRDTRPPMREIYDFYAGQKSPDDVIVAATKAGTPTAKMYAHLYLGLYFEVAGDKELAKEHLLKSAATKMNDNYMHDVAKVHVKLRGW